MGHCTTYVADLLTPTQFVFMYINWGNMEEIHVLPGTYELFVYRFPGLINTLYYSKNNSDYIYCD